MIDKLRGEHTVTLLCETMRVSQSGYYRHRKAGSSAHARRDEELLGQIKEAHRKSRGNYGAPRIVAELAAHGQRTSRRRCARLMREAKIAGRKPHRKKPRTTDSRATRQAPQNRLDMKTLNAPDQAWITDITYVQTAEGWLYVAAILDAWSRKVIGWACALTLHAYLVLDALDKALQNRRPPAGVLHHSDRGSQYASEQYRQTLAQAGMQPSMSRRANCYDNAAMESFWSTLKTETMFAGHVPRTRHEAEVAIFDYIETFYNPQRRHSSLDYLSPVAFEQQYVNKNIKSAA